MLIRYDATELRCLKKMAELFGQGLNQVFLNDESAKQLGLNEQNYQAVLQRFEDHGIISKVKHATTQRYFHFQITAKAVDVARDYDYYELERHKPKDIPSEFQKWWRTHPYVAWTVVFFGGLVFLATAITQITGALKALGIIKGN